MHSTMVRVRLHLPDMDPQDFDSKDARFAGFQVLDCPEMPGTVLLTSVAAPVHADTYAVAAMAAQQVLDAYPNVGTILFRDDI